LNDSAAAGAPQSLGKQREHRTAHPLRIPNTRTPNGYHTIRHRADGPAESDPTVAPLPPQHPQHQSHATPLNKAKQHTRNLQNP